MELLMLLPRLSQDSCTAKGCPVDCCAEQGFKNQWTLHERSDTGSFVHA